MSNYHLFINYCNLYKRLCREANQLPVTCESLGDHKLLAEINRLLKWHGCIPMTEAELDRELY